MAAKTWFITGTSKGFGREWAIAALERGDRVAATARNTDTLKDLVEQYGDAILPIELDDVVEVAPAYDVSEITAIAAATIAHDIICLLAANRGAKGNPVGRLR